VICGDININYLENCKKKQQLDALLQTYNPIGTVSFPTCKSKASITAIDNIFITRTKYYIINPHINGLSDHEVQIIMIENTVLTKQINNITTKRDINDQSILEFQLLLSHENWEETFMEDDANTSFNKFLNTHLRFFHSCFIKKCTNFNTISKPWITKGIKTSCNQTRGLYLKVRDNNEMEHKLYYKQYCKILSEVIKEEKKLYCKEVISKSKNKTKTTWNIIHKETSKLTNENNIKSLRISDHVVYNQITIANELNNYFLNIAGIISNKRINEKEYASPLQNLFKCFNQQFKDISWPYTSAKEINKIIDSLKDKNSSGCDEISTKVIKISKPIIISPLINICNKMLAQGIYPERLKFSSIKPIYKSGDKSSPSNYRPISLLPVFSKILEKVIYKRLFDHLYSNVILNEHQHGFRSEVSTENASYILLSEILTALNNKQMVGGIFCDLHKAFDSINHAILLETMKFYGVSGKFYNLVKSYLDGRYQKVILSHNNGIESTWEKIKQEVP